LTMKRSLANIQRSMWRQSGEETSNSPTAHST
jgi:hypothetical protein